MGELREAFDQAVAGNAQVMAVDAGVVQAGRMLADEIDHAVAHLEGQERTKALYLMPHLMNVMKELLATPAARMSVGLKVEEGSGGTSLGNLQAAAARRRKRSA